MIHVQFSDSSDTAIVSEFLGPQDSSVWKNLGEVDGDDPRYLSFVALKAPSAESLALAKKDALLTAAALQIAPMEDAAQLGTATPDESAALALWREYRVALSRVIQQAGYPGAIVWPVAPE